MARSRKSTEKPAAGTRPIEQYQYETHRRKNNPPVGLVTSDSDREAPKKQYAYDPHLDPTLTWAGKAEHTSFQISTVSLHVHERIDPKTVIEAVRRRNGAPAAVQGSLFESAAENPPLREAIDFYQHAHAWSNRLIAGDSLLVMNSLLEKEGMAGKVQMVYIDPPYGIRYGSNFQPFVNKRDVKDGSDEDLTQEPEMIRAFRDTWELGIHSYLTYLRDRLLLASELLHDSGSCFVQISDENLHHVRELMDETFGPENRMPLLVFRKTTGAGSPSGYVETIPQTADYLLWYAKSRPSVKVRRLYLPRGVRDDQNLRWIELADGTRRQMTREETLSPDSLPTGSRPFRPNPLTSQTGGETTTFSFSVDGTPFKPKAGGWKTNLAGMKALLKADA
ncbi:MAG TPA: DNA methyltransferase [Methylomirabilota bacterium]|nr:DNA methyltransferase [Methylomirabilota bacterium]